VSRITDGDVFEEEEDEDEKEEEEEEDEFFDFEDFLFAFEEISSEFAFCFLFELKDLFAFLFEGLDSDTDV
jgi:hypothetical protein